MDTNYTYYVIRHNISSGEYSEVRNNASMIANSINGCFLFTEIGSSSSTNNIFVWDSRNDKMNYLIKENKNNVTLASFSEDARNVIMWFNKNSTLSLYDVNNGNKILDFNSSGKVIDIYNLAISSDNHIAYSGYYNSITAWDTSTGEELSTAYFFDTGDWIVMTPQGYYDCSDKVDDSLQIRIGDTYYSAPQFRKSFYRPDLVKSTQRGMSLNSYPDIRNLKVPSDLMSDR